MEKTANYDFLNSPLMGMDEINFILLDSEVAEISSSHLKKKGVQSELINILKNDRTGTLLLPFINHEFK